MSENRKLLFQFFNEVGIIHQLSSTLFNKRMPEGLHISHFSVLNHCVRLGDGKTPLALARAFQVTKGTMTHTLSELERRGFVRLEPNQSDGRSKLVFITEEGRQYQRNAIASLDPLMERFHGKLDLDAVMAILPELTKIRQVLDDNRDPQ